MAELIAFPFFTGGRKSAAEKKRPLEKVCREEPYSNGLKFLEVLFKFTFLNLFIWMFLNGLAMFATV